MIRLAICGIGKIGKVHLANLRSLRGCEVAGMFDTDAAELARVSADAGVRAYASVSDLLSDQELDAVVIATPTSSHRELTTCALAAGKHVFVEKPLAGTLADASAIVDAARGSGRVVQVGFCERFNVNYLEAKRAVAAGQLGSIRAVHSARTAPYSFCDPTWELGALDTAVHNLDLILWLTGSAPRSVLARGVRIYPDSDIPHTVVTLLTFENGRMASDQITWLKDDAHPLHICARSRMVLHGDKGSFEIDLGTRPASLIDAAGFRMMDTVIIGGPEYYGCLKLQFEAWLRSIEEGGPVLAPVEDALLTERVVMAAAESLRSGKEVFL